MVLEAARYPHLLTPWTHGRLRLRNRLVHAAMTTRRIVDMTPTDAMVQYYANRAAGGAAVVVTEPLNASAMQTRTHYVRVWDDTHVGWLSRWAEAVERHDCRLLGQLQDSGRGRHERGRNPNAFAPSVLPDDLSWTVPRALTVDEIRRLVDDFSDCAARLERCGFSGVELSAGHGHLFHQFMSPWSNRRDDDYGGELENRTRFVRELVTAIRAKTRGTFLVGLKLPGDDGVAGGIGPDEAERIARRLVRDGEIDYVAFCQGAHARTLDWHIPDMHWPRAPWMSLITRLRAAIPGTPVLALGLITDPAEAEGFLARGEADLVGLGRPLVTDPAWALKASQGREREIRYCVSCNTCWGQIVEGQPLACDNNPRVALPDEVDWSPPRAAAARRVVVVGAGVAGLEAAWIAAARGHAVTVLGASGEPGGKTRVHSLLPGGENLSSVYDYQQMQARRHGVAFEFGVRATADDVLALAPDEVVVATGATMMWPAGWPAAWRDDGLILDGRALAVELAGVSGRQGGTAVLYDMDHTEGTYALAERLAHLFDRVLVVTTRDRVAADVPLVSNLGLQRRFSRRRIEVVPLAEVGPGSSLEDGRIDLVNVHSGAVHVVDDVALLTYSTVRLPDAALAVELTARGASVRVIGDARIPRSLLATTAEGHATGLAL
jgi:2,4-dienoyl-CoA reductase-like NADH-dependent reductase (Old Yellow Enzyme family)